MKLIMKSLLLGVAAAACGAELELRFGFEGVPGPLTKLDRNDLARRGAFCRYKPDRAGGKAPERVAEAPAVLGKNSRSSLRGNGALVWIKRDGKPFRFAEEFSFQFWFKPEELPEKPFYFAVFNKSWRVGCNPRSGRFFVQNLANREQCFSAPVALETGCWHLLTVTGKAEEIRIWLDGRPLCKRRMKQPLPESPELFFGNGSPYGTEFFPGLLDEPMLFRGVLTEVEIREYAAGKLPAAALPEGRLPRLDSSAWPVTFSAAPRRSCSFSTAVIVAAEQGRDDWAPIVRDRFRKEWKVELPILPAADAVKSGKPLIFNGDARGNAALRRLAANLQLAVPAEGCELRMLPEMLDWRVGGLYFGGRTREAVERALDIFFKRFPAPAEVPLISECERAGELPDAAGMVEALRRHYAEPPDYIPNQSAIRLFRAPARAFLMSGKPEYARAFGDMVRIVLEHYDAARGARGTPPSFTFHEFPWMVESVEVSDAFTAEDRAAAAKLMVKAVENMLDYWEMAEPMRLYDSGETGYLTNHHIFASRSVYMAADYLERHCSYEPARYWKAVAANAMRGVENEPFSPEDSANYQYITYRIFMNYAVASGLYADDFFRNGAYRDYIRYVKNLCGTDCFSAGYGDNAPMARAGHWSVLRDAVELFNDEEAEFLLARLAENPPSPFYRSVLREIAPRRGLPEPGKETLGLNIFTNNAFREKFFRIDGLFGRPTLDKAVFRSSWSRRDGEFLMVNGMNGAPHGHFDAGGISRFQIGPNLWLTEGDYIRKYPDEHNTVEVSRNGRTAYPAGRHRSRAAQVVGAVNVPKRNQALLSLRVEEYGGCADWNRRIGWIAGQGVWIADKLTAREPGEFLAQCRWRLLGEPAGPQSFRQKNGAELHWRELTGAESFRYSQFDGGHEEAGRDNGYYSGSPQAGPETRIVVQRRAETVEKGAELRFVNLFTPVAAEVRQLGENLWLAPESLFAAGPAAGPDIEIAADTCLVSPAGVTAAGATRLKFGSVAWESDAPRDVALEFTQNAWRELKRRLEAAARPVPAAAVPSRTLPELPALKFDAAVTALAAGEQTLAAGFADGAFRVISREGKELFRHRFAAPVTAVAVIDVRGRSLYAAGTAGTGNRPAPGSIALFDASGKLLWHREIPVLQQRNGTVRTVFPVRFADGGWALAAGSEAWRYHVFSPEGRELWRRQVYHGATVGLAADLDGDGNDEIVAGNEYYYHLIFDRNGRELDRKTTAPWIYSAVAADLDGDGRAEAVTGRSDGSLQVSCPPANGFRPWSVSVGGRPVGLAVLDGALYAGTLPGQVVKVGFDGKLRAAATLPAPLAAMCVCGDSLLAAGRDGILYELSGAPAVVKRYAYIHDPGEAQAPLLAGGSGFAVLGSSDRIYIIGQEAF